MPAFVSPTVAVVSAILAVASLLLYLHSTRRSDRDSAREEALALAETRGQLVAELRASLKLREQRHKRMQTNDERRARHLETALEEARVEAREQAYQTQRFYAAAFAEVLTSVRSHLEQTPPDVEAALARIRELLATTEQRPSFK
jgi:hypothetical protein